MVTEIKAKWNTIAIIGFALSIIPFVGLGLSIWALIQIEKKPLRGKGLAIAGIIIGAISTAAQLFP
jgi:hypothetical protein